MFSKAFLWTQLCFIGSALGIAGHFYFTDGSFYSEATFSGGAYVLV